MLKYLAWAKRVWLCVLCIVPTFSAFAQLKADFSIAAPGSCTFLTDKFTDETSGGTTPYSYHWTLGNGNSSVLQNPSAIYVSPKTYAVKLVVTDHAGKKDSVTKTVTIFNGPAAGFKVSSILRCPPFSVSFTDQSVAGSAAIAHWVWDFGDGNIDTTHKPAPHSFMSPGSYSVSLYLTDANGCSGSFHDPAPIVVSQLPVVDFSSSLQGGCVPPVLIHFIPKVTSVYKIKSYAWSFGSAFTDTNASPFYDFISTGLYDVTLKVTDSLGCSGDSTKPGFIAIGKPVANFTYSPASGCAPLSVSFKDGSSGLSSKASYYWDFGDGTTSTARNPVHSFSKGTYTVMYIVKNPSGCGDTIIKSNIITVSKGFAAGFLADTVLCGLPFTSSFTNTSGANTHVVKWTFGDPFTTSSSNNMSTAANPSHTYNTPGDTGGVFTASLIVEDNNGCTEQIMKPGYIHARQTTLGIDADSGGCVPLTDSIKPLVTGIDSVISWAWDFGDNTFSGTKSPVYHIYPDTGYYDISLTIKTLHGCKLTAATRIGAGMPPMAGFTGGPYSGCLNSLRHMHFYSTTNNPPAAIKADYYQWRLSDGETIEGPGPVFNAVAGVGLDAAPGKYDLTLAASNHGCFNKITKKGVVTVTGPWANFFVKTNIHCGSDTSFFQDNHKDANQIEYFFADHDSSGLKNPMHTYQSGTWSPSMIVKNDTNGCTDTFTDLPGINIPQIWLVSLVDSNHSGCVPLKIKLTLNNNEPVNNIINFGDGDSGVYSSNYYPSQGISHVYAKKGNYIITLTTTNLLKCTDKIILPDTIRVGGPTVSFSVDKTQGCIPLKILLTDTSPKDNTIVSKIYDMGDGHGFNLTGDTMSYTYATPPIDQNAGYTISLVALDNNNCTNNYQVTVKPTGPVAGFRIDSNYTCNSVLYAFSPENIGFGPFKYAWDMGDGANTAVDTPIHSYNNGYFRVKLQMTDAGGCTDTLSKLIHVHFNRSTPDFTTDTASGKCPPFRVHFTDKSKFAFKGYHGYDWDFGDGSPHAFIQSPDKVYYLPGSYNVTLKITDSLGCIDSIVKQDVITVKGPAGHFTLSSNRSCPPLTVHFKAISSNATKFSWDMGDGTIKSGDTATYTYTNPRNYFPLLFLSDNAGCSYSLPPSDTIIVDPLPVPDFLYSSNCSQLPTLFYDQTSLKTGGIVKWAWNFGDTVAVKGGGSSAVQNPSHIYKKNGYYNVSLTVTTIHGCTGTTTKKVLIGGINAAFTAPDTGCIGAPVNFSDASVSDTSFKSWAWIFGDGTTSDIQNPSYTYLHKGIYTVSLIVENNKGCIDTVTKPDYIVIGDTAAPPPPVIYRATVVNDSIAEVDFSKFTGIDFKSYDLYMKDINGNLIPVKTSLKLNDTIAVISHLNTLKNVYCFEVQNTNVCGHSSAFSLPHCTINVSALPGVDKALISWTPYVGWNISQYLVFRSYNHSTAFSPIAYVPGDSLKYTDTSVVCYQPVSYRIKAVENGGFRQVSLSDTSTTLPVHIPKLPAPQLFHVTVPDNHSALIEWNDLPGTAVKKWIVEKSYDGVKYNILDSPFDRNILSVYDPQVDVQNGSYDYRVNLMDSCGDIGPYSSIGKTILLKADTTAGISPALHWTAYQSWPEGVQYYTIQLKNDNGNFDSIAHTKSGNDTGFIDNVADFNTLKDYCYRVVAHRDGPASNPDQNINITSISNESCLITKTRVFVPGAFTPNNDGINDSFVIKGLYIKDFHIKIYNRWGSMIFESDDIKNSWNGSYKGAKPMPDVYMYLIEITGADNHKYRQNGTVTLMW